MSAQTWPILINCQTRLQANAPQQNNGEPLSVDADAWSKTDYSEKIALAIVQPNAHAAALPASTNKVLSLKAKSAILGRLKPFKRVPIKEK